MRDLLLDLVAAGGIHRSRTLLALGHSRRRLAQAINMREAVRPRIGWIGHPESNPAALRAVALGGRLTGHAALRSLGIWVDRDSELLVACSPNASRLAETRPHERRIWRDDRFPDIAGAEWRVSVLDALLDYGRDAGPDELVASVDSALHLGFVTQPETAALTLALCSAHRHLAERVDADAGSGAETRMRLPLRALGLTVRSQVQIPSVGRVDLVVDGWLIVEIDSRAHHGSPVDQDRDRRRDGNATLGGYATLRFMAMDVLESPEWCLAVVQARLRSGRPVVSVRRSGAQQQPAGMGS